MLGVDTGASHKLVLWVCFCCCFFRCRFTVARASRPGLAGWHGRAGRGHDP